MSMINPDKSGSAQEQVSECVRCERRRPLYARGLCVQCYTLAEEAGQLDRYADSAELDWIDYQHLRRYGIPIEDVAVRLHLETRTALRYERRRRGASYDTWLATLTEEERLRYALPTVVSSTQRAERSGDAHDRPRSFGIIPSAVA
jgi:hypothetical protein